MKKVTLIIPDGYDGLLGITMIGHRPGTMSGINAANKLEVLPLDKDEVTFDFCEEIAEEEEK